MTKIKLALIGFLVFVGVLGYLLFTGPRMKQQQSFKGYDFAMPLPPRGAVPVEDPWPAAATGPLAATAATAENLPRGKVYYEYYCLACHGDAGRGDGPVGQSYDPVPADLRSLRLRAYSDANYMNAILTSPGHCLAVEGFPVLAHIVPPAHRPYVLLYARHFAAATQPSGK